jgi:uncharacterized protein (TIGR01319 family)
LKIAVLTDFGSTFTKVSLVELGTGRLVSHAQAPTTADSDVMNGYRAAVAEALAAAEQDVSIEARLASSSAGGGLRVVSVGLVDELTAAAARQAALNAGARVELVLSGRLTDHDVRALEHADPDIVLFSGGTDDGQRRMVLENAEVVGRARVDAHFVVACNGKVAARAAQLLASDGRRVEVVDNVLPQISSLNVAPAREAIGHAFLHHVIAGKGLSETDEFPRTVIMPTPEAVLTATELLARGADDVAGWVEAVVIDVGGATTDVHSAASSTRSTPGVNLPLLPILPVLRTVQGDLGLRSNAASVMEQDRTWILNTLGPTYDSAQVECAVSERTRDPAFLPADDDCAVDRALATSCLTYALERHCGRLTIRARPDEGVRFSVDGPDLRDAPVVIGTGGILAHNPHASDIVQAALDRCDAQALTPKSPRVVIDRSYILAAAGLLATIDRAAALTLMNSQLQGCQADRGQPSLPCRGN